VTSRKKNILLIQFFIFFLALFLLYNTYRDKSVNSVDEKSKNKGTNIETTSKPSINSFEKIVYSGLDLNGNRYSIFAEKAEFKTEKPEFINMQGMIAYFYFKDDTVLKVIGDTGYYNNKTYNMQFRENVKAEYLSSFLFSDQLTYSNTEGRITISGNVKGESIQGDLVADNIEIDLKDKTANFSMFSNEQVNVNLKN
jgi:hypothetical protein